MGGRALARWSDEKVGVSPNRTLGTRASLVVKPCLMKSFSSHPYLSVWLMLLFSAILCLPISVQGNIILQNKSYSWSAGVTCFGKAHVSDAQTGGTEPFETLSLLADDNNDSYSNFYAAGLAYYNEPVRLLDPSTNTSASFTTSFAVDKVNRTYPFGDGFTFVISADNNTLGGYGHSLGIFEYYKLNTENGGGQFKSIVVEFDTNMNPEAPILDISDNHVSFDFINITAIAARDASDVNVLLGDNKTLYAWIEYSNQTQSLEVRVSNANSRPMRPFLNYTVDLFNVVEEFMWIGFSSSSGLDASDFFVKKWTFESFGILPSSPVSPSPVVLMSPVPASLVSASSKRSKLGLIVGASVGGFALLLASFFIVVLLHRRTPRKNRVNADSMIFLGGMHERFTYGQLSMATNNFCKDSKLGQGGFGSVYRGVLTSGIPVAVKKISGNSKQGEKEFMAEVSIISRLSHRNLIQLLGWCKDSLRGNYLLAYELMLNGSLDKAVYGPAETRTARLSWPQRFNIVMGTATALDYLHQGWTQQVIHRDIKCSNIMLDEKWNAKLGDFGLARLIDHERTSATTLVAGTYGYIAPEVAVSGKFTDKTDVYAFGAVVLEVACGRKALAAFLPEDEMILVDWVWKKLSEGDVLSTVDHALEDYDTYWMEVMLKVGLLCSHPNPTARPTMKHVVQMLSGDAVVPFIPKSKPVLVFSSDPKGSLLDDLDLLINGCNNVTDSTKEMLFNARKNALSPHYFQKTEHSPKDISFLH